MPYVDKIRRKAIFSESTTDFDSSLRNKGELNFRISELLGEYIENHGMSYQNLSDAKDAAVDAADEFRRRFLDKYEDKCIKLNGDLDVYKRLDRMLRKVK